MIARHLPTAHHDAHETRHAIICNLRDKVKHIIILAERFNSLSTAVFLNKPPLRRSGQWPSPLTSSMHCTPSYSRSCLHYVFKRLTPHTSLLLSSHQCTPPCCRTCPRHPLCPQLPLGTSLPHANTWCHACRDSFTARKEERAHTHAHKRSRMHALKLTQRRISTHGILHYRGKSHTLLALCTCTHTHRKLFRMPRKKEP